MQPISRLEHATGLDTGSMDSRRVSAQLDLRVHQQSETILQVAVAGMAGLQVEEDLTVRRDGEPVKTTEIAMTHGGRAHLLVLEPGRVRVEYGAVIRGAALRPAHLRCLRMSW